MIAKAMTDLNLYCEKAKEASVNIPFVLGVSGNICKIQRYDSLNNSLTDLFIEDFQTNSKTAITINAVSELRKYKDTLKAMYQSNTDTFVVNIPGLTQDEIIGFCVDINKELHAIGIKESERATILTYFLICCLSDKFLDKLDNLSTDDIFVFSKTTFKQTLKDKNFTLNKNAFSIITDEHDKNDGNEDYTQYKKGFDRIINIIDLQIANQFKGKNLTRKLFIERLMQSGNFLGDAYEVFHTYATGNDLGQYFTPRHAVDLMIYLIENIRKKAINSEDIIYDPACGVGGFLCLAMKHATTGKTPEEKKAILSSLGSNIYGSELEPLISDMARVNMLLRGDGKSGIVTGSSLDKHHIGTTSPIKKLLEVNKAKPTIVLMNPPFPSDKSDFESYEFIEHAVEVAADGAYSGVIIPIVVINGKKGFKEFRKRMLGICELKASITLPVDLFEPKATVDTAIIILKKTGTGHHDSSVIFASCKNDGLKMHKGKKQRVADFNSINDFQILLNHWLPNTYTEIFEKFNYVNPVAVNKDYFLNGGEWTPYQWLNDNPINIEESEIIRLTKYIITEYKNGANIKNLGGRW